MNKLARLQAYAQKARDRYEESGQRDYASMLIYGDYGTGKTQCLATAPKPIWIHSFDPGGTKTRALQSLIQSGECIVDARFEDVTGSDWRNPSIWKAWEAEFDEMESEGVFDSIGTFAIDSFTKMSDALMFEIMGRSGQKGKTPQIQNYLHQQFAATEVISRLSALKCHTVITGHMQRERNDYTGKIETSMLLYGKLAEKVPLCLDEKLLTIVKESRTKSDYVFQTQNDGEYRASTRMGGGLFAKYEPQNIKALLKRAGKSWEDKPSLASGEEDS